MEVFQKMIKNLISIFLLIVLTNYPTLISTLTDSQKTIKLISGNNNTTDNNNNDPPIVPTKNS